MEASGLKEGDEVEVKLIEIDKRPASTDCRCVPSQPKPEGYVEPQRAPRGNVPAATATVPMASGAPRGDRGPRQPRKD